MPVPAVPDPGVGAPAEPSFRPLPAPPPPWQRAVEWVQANRHRLPLTRRRAVMALVGLGLVGLLAVVVVRAVAVAGPPPEIILPRASPGPAPAGGGGAGAGVAGEESVVYVVGAVARPGLVRLSLTARVGDAVTAAGGAVEGADLDQMNLAAPVADGDKVFVPRKGEAGEGGGGAAAAGSGSGAGSGSAVINLNSATVAALDELPGVGPSLAAAIVEYRKQHGRFRSVQDLLEVPGIGPAKLAALKARVRV